MTEKKRWKQGLPQPTGQFVSDEQFMAALAGPVRAEFILRVGGEWDSIPHFVDRRNPDDQRRFCVVTAVAAVLRNEHHGYGDYLDAGAALGWDASRSQRFSSAFDGVSHDHDRGLRAWMASVLTSPSGR